MITHKTCTKCKTEKEISEFSKSGTKSNDGYCYVCKSCANEYARMRYAIDSERRRKDHERHAKFKREHPEEYRAQKRASEQRYAEKHPEKVKEKNRKSYEKNKEGRNARHKAQKLAQEKITVDEKVCARCNVLKKSSEFRKTRYTKDTLQTWCKDCQNEYHRDQFANNPDFREKRIEKDKIWAANNPEKRQETQRKSSKKYAQAHPEVIRRTCANRRARIIGNGGFHSVEEWKDLCNTWDNRCICCGRSEPLTEDHIIPLSKGGTDDIDNIQPLCRSCNSRKNDQFIDYRNPFVAMAT